MTSYHLTKLGNWRVKMFPFKEGELSSQTVFPQRNFAASSGQPRVMPCGPVHPALHGPETLTEPNEVALWRKHLLIIGWVFLYSFCVWRRWRRSGLSGCPTPPWTPSDEGGSTRGSSHLVSRWSPWTPPMVKSTTGSPSSTTLMLSGCSSGWVSKKVASWNFCWPAGFSTGS